jgi:Zn-finger nucleic acid-binding protein
MCLRDGRECLTCDYCQSVYFPEKNQDGVRVLDEASDQACPVCAVLLMHAILAAHPVLYCTRCRGSLIPAPVFVLALEDLRARQPDSSAIPQPPDPHELERRIRCPQCHRTMDTHYYAGPGNIVIDDCPSCELNWVDAGELMVIVRAPDHAWRYEPEVELPE